MTACCSASRRSTSPAASAPTTCSSSIERWLAELPVLAPAISRALLMLSPLGSGPASAAAYVLERLDDKIRIVEEVERITGLATLGVIPQVRSDIR